ncbi:MAG: hypothetical protein Q7W02_03220 [Candidatus Rokubacteria bacterium]|nr:hypothetical protein [Candidatus Rokubacteria bacterium]
MTRPGVSGLLPLVTAIVGVCFIWASPALAQRTTLPPSLTTSNPQSAFIKNQLTLSTELARKTLAGLAAMPADDSIPIDEATLQNARDTYVLIRAARHGMELARETSRFPDPTRELAFKRVDAAWNLARTPVDRASTGIARAQYLQESIRSLRQAVQLLDQAMIIMP